jgi:hypothetical protein
MKLLKRDQPWSILLLSALLIFGAVAGIIAAIAVMVLGAVIGVFIPMLSIFIGAAAIIMFLVALAYIALAYGLLIHSSIAWWVVFIFADLGLLGAIVSVFTLGLGGIFPLIIAVGVVAVLLHKDTIGAIEPLKAIDVAWSGWSLEEE